MKKIISLLAMTALAGPAFAADAIVYEEPAPVAVQDYSSFNWTGGYIGAHAGYGWGKTEDVYNDEAPSKKLKGGLGGIQAGYNWQFDNNVVLGAEADVTFSGVKKNWTDTDQYSTYYTKDKIGANGTVRARLGYAADRFLPYVTGGLAWAHMKHTVGCLNKDDLDQTLYPSGSTSCRDSNTDGRTSFDKSATKNAVGYTVGAGMEYAVDNNWTVKAEYLYKNFGKNKVTIKDPNWPGDGVRNFKTHVNEVRIGVNYKF